MLVALVLASGCSSETERAAPKGCTDIAGNYKLTSERVSGSCDPALEEEGDATVTMSKGDEGAWDILLPGIEGGCPGKLDPNSCKYIATCKAIDKATGATIITYNVDYTFAGTTLAGSSTGAAMPPYVPKVCDVTYRETGERL